MSPWEDLSSLFCPLARAVCSLTPGFSCPGCPSSSSLSPRSLSYPSTPVHSSRGALLVFSRPILLYPSAPVLSSRLSYPLTPIPSCRARSVPLCPACFLAPRLSRNLCQSLVQSYRQLVHTGLFWAIIGMCKWSNHKTNIHHSIRKKRKKNHKTIFTLVLATFTTTIRKSNRRIVIRRLGHGLVIWHHTLGPAQFKFPASHDETNVDIETDMIESWAECVSAAAKKEHSLVEPYDMVEESMIVDVGWVFLSPTR